MNKKETQLFFKRTEEIADKFGIDFFASHYGVKRKEGEIDGRLKKRMFEHVRLIVESKNLATKSTFDKF